MRMFREPILELIRDYAARWPDERETVQQFEDFILSQPNCFERWLMPGHLTGSAWVVNQSGASVLLTHHRKLDAWVQLGGHADGDPDMCEVALREAYEESGLDEIDPVATGIFDLDIHRIPARGHRSEHLHYDVRFVFRCGEDDAYVVTEESHDLAWVPLSQLGELTVDHSIHRMARKWVLLDQLLQEQAGRIERVAL